MKNLFVFSTVISIFSTVISIVAILLCLCSPAKAGEQDSLPQPKWEEMSGRIDAVESRVDQLAEEVADFLQHARESTAAINKIRSEMEQGFAKIADRHKQPTPAVPVAAPAPKASPKPAVSVLTKQHSHTCPNGHTWWHSDSSFGDRAAHTCSECGVVVWDQNTVMSMPATNRSSCPGGVCPRPSTRRWFRR